jgi:hypothetical protein
MVAVVLPIGEQGSRVARKAVWLGRSQVENQFECKWEKQAMSHRNNVVKILSALAVVGAMTLSGPAMAQSNNDKAGSARLTPTPWATQPLAVKLLKSSPLAPFAMTSAVPPESRLSAYIVGGAVSGGAVPSFLARVPKGVRYANGAWQVYNPSVGVFCIWPAATTGIYLDQIFPIVTVDWSNSLGWALFAYYRSTSNGCAPFATALPPDGLGLVANPFIEIDTYSVATAPGPGDLAPPFLWNQVAFNVVVQ